MRIRFGIKFPHRKEMQAHNEKISCDFYFVLLCYSFTCAEARLNYEQELHFYKFEKMGTFLRN